MMESRLAKLRIPISKPPMFKSRDTSLGRRKASGTLLRPI